ncbi:hypothetical protein [Nocardia sp. NPDC050406]|uniref:hypothetical protein n=1 Tax=Nocardia sp. NPDC050406 TaxID=3364318 RepID=UPI0037AE87D2
MTYGNGPGDPGYQGWGQPHGNTEPSAGYSLPYGGAYPTVPGQQPNYGQPNWSAPQSNPPSGNRGPLIALAVVSVLAVAVVTGVAVWALNRDTGPSGPVASATSTAAATTTSAKPTTTTSTTSPTSTGEAGIVPTRPSVNPPRDGRAGPVAGPTYGPGEDLYHFKVSGNVPFDYDLPGTWGCVVGSTKITVMAVKVCRDETGGTDAGGWIGIDGCANGCAEADYLVFRDKLPIDAPNWRVVDANTQYAELSGELNGKQALRVAMTYTFASRAGGPLDTIAFAQMTGAPSDRETMQKILNEIRIRAQG